MNAILTFLLKLFPTLFPKVAEKKGAIATVVGALALCATLWGMYTDLSGNLSAAKAARDEQIKGYAVQIGVLHSEVNSLKERLAAEEEDAKEKFNNFREWNKSISKRLNEQEQAELARQSVALENRINRLEDAAMTGKPFNRKHR
jgi:biopolymer transport protein ExbB/TolQ